MKWFLTFLIFSFFFESAHLLDFFASHSAHLQKTCAASLPDNFEHRNLARSFLCGLPLDNPNEKEIFRRTGLLHLMVVSGGHLQILTLALTFLLGYFFKRGKFKFLRLGLWFFLFGYCLMTGFQAPVVRAFGTRLVSWFNHHFRLNWDAGKIQLFTGFGLLCLFPSWLQSLSFYLSWLAALGFLLTPLYRNHQKDSPTPSWSEHLLNCLLVQSLMAVFFAQFSVLGALVNVLITPLLSLLLFPLSFSPAAWDGFSPAIDVLWEWILSGLKWLAFTSSALDASVPRLSQIQWILLWSFIALVHSLFEALRRYRYRGSNV